MNILGINGALRQGNHDGAAVLVQDGKIAAAAEEERFIGIKHSPGVLPEMAIKFCLRKAGIKFRDVDLIVFPGRTYENIKGILKNYFNFKFGYTPAITLIDHHFAHAASSYFMSGFKDSLIITADLSGDSRSTVLFYAEKDKIKEVEGFPKPNSLGIFYALITQYLGFQYNNDECKVMALAGLGKPRIDLSWLLKFSKNGYALNTKYIDSRIQPGDSNPSLQEPLFTALFKKKIGRVPRRSTGKIEAFHKDLASSAQDLLEQAYDRLLEALQNRFKCSNLCLAGGIALNVELNRKIASSGKLKKIFVQPVASDAGLALGGALYQSLRKGDFKPKRLCSLFLGPEYSDREIKGSLDRLNIKYVYHKDDKDIERNIAHALSEGKVVAMFWGPMEYGPRALGNRSILADPRCRSVRDKINLLIKERENFQPFAPSVLESEFENFFETPLADVNLEFMAVNVKAKARAGKMIPAVVHSDGTSRVQVVRKKTSPRFHKVIKLFAEHTGIPVLLNTSMNLRKQPIARTPLDAVNVFSCASIDCLAIGNFWIQK